jgi:hypothetical protein
MKHQMHILKYFSEILDFLKEEFLLFNSIYFRNNTIKLISK